MEQRAKFSLRRPLFAWNLLLALFSAVGTWRVTKPMVADLITMGWSENMCTADYQYDKPQMLWIYIFSMSKLPELFDTLFIVLRKQDLTFLHVYHHISVFVYSLWSLSMIPFGQARLFPAMNYFVHTVMYFYYALRAQGILRLPQFVSKSITLLQIAQMIVGFAASIDAVIRYQLEIPCIIQYGQMCWCTIMYLSYFVLFVQFFYRRYTNKN